MITKRPLMYWVKNSNKKLQLMLLVVIVFTVGVRLVPLEMQKLIINQAISMRKVDLLFMYCGFYIASVVSASLLKYLITVLQTYIGQESLAQMRKELYAHILTLPLGYFRKANPGMVVSSLITEMAPAGEYVGQSIAVPVTNVLTLIAFATYMFYLNATMAAISIALYPFVIYLVPKLQKKSNKANKQRVDTTRNLSSHINETISGIHEIHGNGSYRIENRKYGSFVDRLFKIRITWILYKQGIKVLNNFFQNLGPFLLFIVGGYLAIQGRFDLGALVAFLSAYEKIYDPWKELMDFYQVHNDATVRYGRVMEYFDTKPEFELEPEGREPIKLKGHIEVQNLGFTVSGGVRLLKQINMQLKPGEQMALVGFSGSGKSTLAQCVSQLYKYTGGSVKIDGYEVDKLTKADMVHNMGIVAQSPFIFSGSIKDNLLYSCAAVLEGDPDAQKKMPTRDQMIESIQQAGIFVDVLRFGLNTLLDTDKENELSERLVRVRKNFHADFGDVLAEHVEFYREGEYLNYSTVAGNITFGHANDSSFAGRELVSNKYFLSFLQEAHLEMPLLSLGRELAKQTVDILGNLPPDEVFFEQSPIPSEEFEDYKQIVSRIDDLTLQEIDEKDREMLLHLAFGFVPGRHKIVALPAVLKGLILDGRKMFNAKVSQDNPETFSFFKMTEFIPSQTILDNILFGKPKTDHPKVQDTINKSMIQLLIEEDLLETVVELGMDFEVGTKGDKLSGGQKQKLAIARTFLKNPPIMIMDEATSALDNRSQNRIQGLLETKWKGKATLISVIHRLDTIKNYDKVAVMKAGKLMEIGPYDELIAKKGLLYELIHGAH
ncbi:ABC transporter ATP-binding protein/permease [Maridesulfovibrio hydrothermalis]|uniref:ABC transporter related n=1 Tax=Maridesulfovibrio hydrothermalis AM13 = DSM 14728 TaxID=1121451 RepID=L0R7F6_9BACT|nr:ABC transporter ATP-binding protein/permease [Maridesulfovibrio hydrothermalis]CCO22120.1 ABC transporter related [Maridesulfovibrio hydrothermalis AM13 = DSM 14728]